MMQTVAVLSLFLLSAVTCLSQGNITKREPHSIYVYAFKLFSDATYDAQRVKTNAIRKIDLIRPHVDPCSRQYEEMALKGFGEWIERPMDVRLVYVAGTVELAFEANGEHGTVNGRGIKFSEEVQEWFRKYLRPLAAPTD